MIPGKQLTVQDVLAIARRRKWLIVLPFVALSVATFFVTRAIPNRYRSNTLILVIPQRVPESYVKSTVTARIENRLESITQQILSRTRLERTVQDFNLYAEKRRTAIMEDVVDQMRKDIDIHVIKGDAFTVSYTGDDPRTVTLVTQRLTSLFIDENLRDRTNLAEGSYQFLDGQLENARRRLLDHERKLEEYRRRYAGQLPSQFQSNLQVIQNTQMQIQALIEAMARDRDRRLMLERAIADATVSNSPSTIAPGVALGDTSGGSTAASQLEAAQQALRQMELRLKPEHPDMVRAKRVVASLDQKARAETAQAQLSGDPKALETTSVEERARQKRIMELNTELDSLKQQLVRKEEDEKRLRQVIADYQARLESIPTRETEMTELMRDYGTLQNSYTGLLAKKEDSKVAADMERDQIGEQFKVLDPARLPEKPVSPDRVKLNLLGAAIGLGLGLSLTLFLEYSDSTLRTDDDVINALSLPVLALVPIMLTTGDRTRAYRRRWAVAIASAATAVLVAVVFFVWKFTLPGIGA